MLPSTGHFKEVRCPFFESGLCERPHCHFRHVRRDPPLLDRLVSEAVKKALEGRDDESPASVPSVTYRPTPIAELDKRQSPAAVAPPVQRHVPVPYTPTPRRRLAAATAAASRDCEYTPSVPFMPSGESASYSPTPEYRPVSTVRAIEAASRYTPTPLSKPDFSSDDDDDDALRLDDMEAEFETLGEIIDDERNSSKEPEKSAPAPKKESRGSDRKRKEHSGAESSRSSDRKRGGSTRESRDDGKRRKSDGKNGHRSSDRSRSAKDKRPEKSERPRDSKRSGERKKERRKSKERPSEKSAARRAPRPEPEPELSFSVEDDQMEIFSSDSDEETIKRECMKIFEEYVPAEKSAPKEPPPKRDETPEEDARTGRKRVAHAGDLPPARQTPKVLRPDHKTSALIAMAERTSKVKSFHEARVRSNTVVPDAASAPPSGTSRVRIAHVPYVSSLLEAKKAIPKAAEPPKVTVTQTAVKGSGRIAHVPNDKFRDRPGVLEPLSSRVPVNVRTKFLNLMIDECLKIYPNPEDAYDRAAQEELATSKKCKAIPIYSNSAMLAISRLRKEFQEMNDDGVRAPVGKGAANGESRPWSIVNRRKSDAEADQFTGAKFYENVSRWVLTESELQENGFPRPHPESTEKGRAKIYTKNTRQRPPEGSARICCRCRKRYVVDKKGFPVAKEECIYHPNNKYRYRGEVKYQCCGQDATSDGCLSAQCHVYEYVDHDNLKGFVRTLPKEAESDHGVYALDCEMCYTTNGLDLTRVTVIDSKCRVVYETLVKPIFPIIDYNTRYSGLTEETMNACTTSLPEVQATFLHMFSEKTVLIGHSLESDFKALKLIHDTVVDTSVLFPHKMGLPYKRALRNLSSEYLKKIIQNSVEGHDSAEDATVCMELIIWKLKEELKIR